MNKTSILVVEDDAPVRNLITTTLKAHDYRYLTAPNGERAILEASSHNPDIVLLDLGLPDMDGMEVIRKIRSWSNMPIIIISAKCEDSDKVDALDAGAEDSVFINGDLRIDYAAGCTYLGERELHLTPIEYKLLCLLSRNVGKVLTHTFITQKIWGASWENDIASLRVFMATLRKNWKAIHSLPSISRPISESDTVC